MAVPSDLDIISTLADDLPVGLWVARAPSGELVYANRMFREIMGTGGLAEQRTGEFARVYGIFTRDGVPYPENRLPFARALQERTVVVVDDIVIRRPDGADVDVRAFARPAIDSTGDITHVVIAFFDITREAAAQRARAESEHRLQRAQRLESIGTLAGGIAHDFNNLIFGVKLIATELASGEPDAKRRQSLAVIDEMTERAANLTRSLLGFARRGKHRAAPVALDVVVAGMRELLTRALTGIEIEFDLEAHDRGAIVGDQSQLEQVVLNLVLNARDAVNGSGRVAIRTSTHDNAAPLAATGQFAGGTAVVLEVADDGPGIDPEHRDRVFEPYFTTKTQGPDSGTGLGLATVLGIVESHGGSIDITSGLDGRGTTFRVYLPTLAGTTCNGVEAVVSTRPDVPHGTGTILIVDDDHVVRRAISLAISNLGYETAEAVSGADAVEIYRMHTVEIRAIVLDMVMPGMNGRATYLALREIEPEVPVLLMSGYTLNEEVQAILDLGVRGFVSKPYSVEVLARELATLTA